MGGHACFKTTDSSFEDVKFMYLDSNPIDMYASIAQWYRSGLVIQRELVRFPLASFSQFSY